MLTYEEYKAKVYKIFMKRCLPTVNEQDKKTYLSNNEDIIKDSYTASVYEYEKLGRDAVFTDRVIYSGVCDNLEMLY